MACLPIIVLLLLMIKFQWGYEAALGVGLAITIITGIVFYKADIRLLAASAKGIWSALIILPIVWIMILYQVADEARAFLVIRNGMRKRSNELLMVLALGWILESFLQGITGDSVYCGSGELPAHGHWSSSRIRSHHTFIGAGMGQYLRCPGSCLGDALAMSTGLAPGTPDWRLPLWAGVFIWMCGMW